MGYYRVIPRDLFNEAKLLKCLGQLALLIHDGIRIPAGLKLDHFAEDEGFKVEQDESSAALYCTNLELTHNGRLIGLHSPYNNKDTFPLLFILDDEEGPVFNDTGTFSAEFQRLLKSIHA